MEVVSRLCQKYAYMYYIFQVGLVMEPYFLTISE